MKILNRSTIVSAVAVALVSLTVAGCSSYGGGRGYSAYGGGASYGSPRYGGAYGYGPRSYGSHQALPSRQGYGGYNRYNDRGRRH